MIRSYASHLMAGGKIIGIAAMILALIISVSAYQQVLALSAEDKDALNQNWPQWDKFSIYDECTPGGSIAENTLPNNIPAIWREVLTKAAASRNTNVQLLAAIYLTENGNVWKPFDFNWAVSPVGASGPFQFMPMTWPGHAADGNGDGVKDVMNVWDAAFASADYIADLGTKTTSKIGDINKPMTRDTLVYYSVGYNAGGGTMQRSDANWSLEDLGNNVSTEAKEYAMNVHALITTGFTKKGKPAYSDPRSIIPGSESGNEKPDPDINGVNNSVPDTGSDSEGSCSGSVGGGGLVSAEGFAFPVAPQTKRDYSDLPCNKPLGCHWDGTSAFDLLYGSEREMGNQPVYALSDGEITMARSHYGGVPKCYHIGFRSTKDTFHYWYGHIQNPTVRAGAKVKAGDKIAETAAYELGPGCWLGRTHLHIDRGCIIGGVPQPGGLRECRDPKFTQFLNGLWATLKENGAQ